MFSRRKPKADYSDLIELLSADASEASNVCWRALQRCLMPEGATIEALSHEPGLWRAVLRVPGLKPTFFDAPDQMAAMVGALLKHHASPAAVA